MKVVVYSPKARRALLGLPDEIRLRIVAKIERYAQTRAGDVKAVSGAGLFRLRVGDYRVLLAEDGGRIAVTKIGHRLDVY